MPDKIKDFIQSVIKVPGDEHEPAGNLEIYLYQKSLKYYNRISTSNAKIQT